MAEMERQQVEMGAQLLQACAKIEKLTKRLNEAQQKKSDSPLPDLSRVLARVAR